jgi:hypothetical protein
MITAVDLIEDRLDIDSVIELDPVDRGCEVSARRAGAGREERIRRGRVQAERGEQRDIGGAEIRIDFGREKVVDIGARPTGRPGVRVVAVHDVIGAVLV